MSAQIFDGKAIAAQICQNVKQTVAQRLASGHRPPGLAVILVGNNAASQVYVRHKRAACKETGIQSFCYDLPAATEQATLMALIAELNQRRDVDGILVQLPLPPSIQPQAVIEGIGPNKDIDGFHPCNIGHLALRLPLFRSCTPRGIMSLLASTGISLAGKHAVVVGASNHVGRPMALELLMAKCTVTVCHSQTKDIKTHTRAADILIAAVGNSEMITADWIKPDAIVIDVGINQQQGGHLVGDIDFDSVKQVAGWLSPVPGGVGPMTVASLLENTLDAAQLHDNQE